jgi:hypothetical protein
MSEAMDDNTKMIESLFERATEYGKTSYELVKLKVIDKTSETVSSLIPNSIVFILIVSFLIFLNLGLAFWLGEMLGEVFYGFFIIAGFYGIVGIIMHLFMHKWLKRRIANYIIKMLIK